MPMAGFLPQTLLDKIKVSWDAKSCTFKVVVSVLKDLIATVFNGEQFHPKYLQTRDYFVV